MHNLTKCQNENHKEPVSATPDMYKSDGVNLANYILYTILEYIGCVAYFRRSF